MLLVVNASNPSNLVTNTVAAPADINGMTVSGDQLLATSGAGLEIYQIGALTTQSVTAEVTVPTTGAAAVVPNSFSVQPNQIIPGSGTETLVWDLTLAPGAGSQQITWETTLNGLAAGQVVAVATGASIQVGNEQFTLPASNVAGIPETQTIEIPVDVVVPGVPAIANAAVAAEQIGNTNLADQLNDLSIGAHQPGADPDQRRLPGPGGGRHHQHHQPGHERPLPGPVRERPDGGEHSHRRRHHRRRGRYGHHQPGHRPRFAGPGHHRRGRVRLHAGADGPGWRHPAGRPDHLHHR